jgi:hypothetical protein
VKVPLKQIIELHTNTYDQMHSRKYFYKLFQYKRDFSVIRKDVSAILSTQNKKKFHDTSPFIEEMLSSFDFLS